MKIGNWTPPTRNQFPDLPDWWEKITKSLTKAIQDLISCLQGRFTLEDNSNAELKELKVRHNTQHDVQLQTLKTAPIGAILIFSSIPDMGRLTEFTVMSEKSIRIKVTFTTDPQTEVTVRLYILGGSA